MKKLTFNDLYVYMDVKDSTGKTGYIDRIENIYNIVVKYNDNSGGFLACLDEKDELYTPLFI